MSQPISPQKLRQTCPTVTVDAAIQIINTLLEEHYRHSYTMPLTIDIAEIKNRISTEMQGMKTPSSGDFWETIIKAFEKHGWSEVEFRFSQKDGDYLIFND